MRRPVSLCVLALTVSSAAPSVAQESRYQIERTENGYVRLDTQTGETSLCREQGSQLVCQMAAEDRRALEDEIDALADRVAALEAAVGERAPDDTSGLPSEEELERSMGIMETFMRRFFAIIDDLNRDFNEDTAPEPAPDRT